MSTTLAGLKSLVANDGLATTFQSLGHYRSVLLLEIAELIQTEQTAYLAGAKAMQEEAAKVCDDNYWEDHRLFADAIRAIDPDKLAEGA